MFFGALSTDIKKSSTIWANLPLWMQKAVERTNNITEFIINNTKNKDIEQHILPNSPEGDAWTVVYMCKDQKTLKEHVKHVAQFLKHVYKVARERYILQATPTDIEKDLVSKYKDNDEEKQEAEKFIYNPDTPFYREIYVRIGVAFDTLAPIEYYYEAKTPDHRITSYKSYWESVIKQSERAEEQAPWEKGIGVTQTGEKVIAVEPKNDKDTTFLITLPARNSDDEEPEINLLEFALDLQVYGETKYEIKEVDGYMIFVHYHLKITMEEVKEDPHLYDALVSEFKLVHLQTVETFKDVFEEKAFLVKVKRSADSMFYLSDVIAPSTVWNNCLSLCAGLPEGSSIGIAFTRPKKFGRGNKPTGTLKRLTAVEPNARGVKKVDYFGDCVNLSARMDTLDWEYDTMWFRPKKNDHHSRVAMCSADGVRQGWEMWQSKGSKGQSFPGARSGKNAYIRPFLIEDIPRDSLNAGKKGQYLRVISAHIYLVDHIQRGDDVFFTLKTKAVLKKQKTKGRRGSLTSQNFEGKRVKEEDLYYGRVIRVNFLFILIQRIEGKRWPDQWKEPNEWKQWINISYVDKCPQEELTPEAEKLDTTTDKPHINKRLFSLKF